MKQFQRTKKEVVPEPVPTNPKFQTLRGMRDILPNEQKYWQWVKEEAEKLAKYYSFQRIDTPIMEETALFRRGVGATTDIVEKEMYSFVDQGGDKITLRPEITASVARAYIQHGMLNMPQPVKLFYCGQIFRHERPQSGRFREFWQAGFEVLGEKHPVIDAHLIQLCLSFFEELGVPVKLDVNSIGCPTCRENYKKALVEYYKSHRHSLCENCKRRLVKNPMRLLDCKEPGCGVVKKDAPAIVNFLCEECKAHFMKVVEYLDDLEIPYNLNPLLVRGLDYYSKTVFEVFENKTEDKAEERNDALAAGGRYDGLVEELGGRVTPSAGFSIGIDRVITAIKNKNITPKSGSIPKVFVAQLGEMAKKKAILLTEELRKANIVASETFSKDSLKAQLEIASKMGVKFVLILGQKEVKEKVILIRDMESGVQEIIDYNKIIGELKKRI